MAILFRSVLVLAPPGRTGGEIPRATEEPVAAGRRSRPFFGLGLLRRSRQACPQAPALGTGFPAAVDCGVSLVSRSSKRSSRALPARRSGRRPADACPAGG